ncbi:hypothetical protein [Flavobacterium sp.]
MIISCRSFTTKIRSTLTSEMIGVFHTITSLNLRMS